MRYDNQFTLITGGSRGIGAGCVRVFVRAGSKPRRTPPGLVARTLRRTKGNVINLGSLVGTISTCARATISCAT
jgi:short-subunit dehydrogenase